MDITVNTNKLSLSASVKNSAEAFKVISDFQEIFGVQACGHCGKTNLRYICRNAAGYDYYEIACADCNHRLQFGQRQDGTGLFPKRKDKGGNWLADNGWVPPFKAGDGGDDINF